MRSSRKNNCSALNSGVPDELQNSETIKILNMSENQRCKVMFKGIERTGIILESKMDKIKVKILDSTNHFIKNDWFEKKEVKRLW